MEPIKTSIVLNLYGNSPMKQNQEIIENVTSFCNKSQKEHSCSCALSVNLFVGPVPGGTRDA